MAHESHNNALTSGAEASLFEVPVSLRGARAFTAPGGVGMRGRLGPGGDGDGAGLWRRCSPANTLTWGCNIRGIGTCHLLL